MQANRESEFALELRHVNHHYGSKQIPVDLWAILKSEAKRS